MVAMVMIMMVSIMGMILMLTLAMMQSCCDVMFDLILFSTYFDKCALYQLVESVIWSDRHSDVTCLSNTDLWEFSPSSSIFSLLVSYSAKSGRQQRPPHAMHWPEIQNWFLPRQAAGRHGQKLQQPRKRNPTVTRCAGSGSKNSPLWPVVPLDSGRAEWQCADIHSPPAAAALINCDTPAASYFFSVADNQICCWRWNHISPGGHTLPYFSTTPYHISPPYHTLPSHIIPN